MFLGGAAPEISESVLLLTRRSLLLLHFHLKRQACGGPSKHMGVSCVGMRAVVASSDLATSCFSWNAEFFSLKPAILELASHAARLKLLSWKSAALLS